MKKMQNKGFTLVELIVVITILAILGTIAFISLQGYSADARDSKRSSDISSLVKKVNIEQTKGTSMSSLVTGTTTTDATINGSGTLSRTQGAINFATIKENQADFQDKTSTGSAQDYVIAYAIGGSGTGSFNFLQIATKKEADNSAVVKGNYYKMDSGDSESIISASTIGDVVDKGSVLPY